MRRPTLLFAAIGTRSRRLGSLPRARKTSMRRLPILLALLTSLVAGVSAEASTSTVRPHRAPKLAAEALVTHRETKNTKNFWTARRIEKAVPLDMRSTGGPAPAVQPATESTGFTGGATGETTAAAVTPVEDYWRNSYTAMPARATGRIFMKVYNGSTGTWSDISSCSATVISAENRATVWTAAHCLYQTKYNVYHRNITFCPAYRDTNGTPWQSADCQLGFWYPKFRNVPNEWVNAVCGTDGRHCTNAEYHSDFGAMTMRPYGTGTTLIQSHTGAHILRYNVSSGAHHAFGYPFDPPFDGRWLYYCYGDAVYAHTHLVIPCHATGGASGGPWLTAWNSTTGRSYLDSVNSHSSGNGYMHGPFQGAIAQRLYNLMRNQDPF